MCCQKIPPQSPTKWVGIVAIQAYRWTLSPVFYALGVRCRHEPSCSLYAMDVIRAQGLWRGGWLAAGRIARCRPGGTHGYDPAPVKQTEVPWWKIWSFRGNAPDH